MSLMKIGIFDSGIGGFSILRELFKSIPTADFFYIADHEFCPYGTKSPDKIRERCHLLVKELLKFNIDLIVVACNTATAISIEELRDKFKIPFVGIEPYLNILNQKENLADLSNVAAIMTSGTYHAKKFMLLKNEKDPLGQISYYPLKDLAGLIESYYPNLQDEKFISLAKKELGQLKANHSHLILGCTHYPLIKDLIEDFLQLKTISPCKNVVKRITQLMNIKEADHNSYKNLKTFQFYSTTQKIWVDHSREL